MSGGVPHWQPNLWPVFRVGPSDGTNGPMACDSGRARPDTIDCIPGGRGWRGAPTTAALGGGVQHTTLTGDAPQYWRPARCTPSGVPLDRRDRGGRRPFGPTQQRWAVSLGATPAADCCPRRWRWMRRPLWHPSGRRPRAVCPWWRPSRQQARTTR